MSVTSPVDHCGTVWRLLSCRTCKRNHEFKEVCPHHAVTETSRHPAVGSRYEALNGLTWALFTCVVLLFIAIYTRPAKPACTTCRIHWELLHTCRSSNESWIFRPGEVEARTPEGHQLFCNHPSSQKKTWKLDPRIEACPLLPFFTIYVYFFHLQWGKEMKVWTKQMRRASNFEQHYPQNLSKLSLITRTTRC